MPRHKPKENNCVCQECGKAFHLKPYKTATNRGRFCSRDCQHPKRHLSIADRFFDLVGAKTETGCIHWNGPIDKTKGYGSFHATIAGKKPLGAHRISYELMVGPIPKGLYVLHRCDNRICINPTHLFLGTHLDNIADCNAKGRQARGEKQGNSKLTTDDIHEIRRRCQNGESQRSIAELFGVRQSAISRIFLRIDWKHII